MSTPSERKLVTFLRKLQTGGGLDSEPLAYIQKIYSDRPRKDLTATSQFPRVQVREISSNAAFSGISATDRLYEVTLECVVYVDMDSPFVEATVNSFWDQSRNMSPEEACGAICYHISKELAQNKATLHSDNSNLFILRGNASFTNMGVDNTYFKNLNVYKSSMSFDFYLRD